MGPLILLCSGPCTVWLKAKTGNEQREKLMCKHMNIRPALTWQICPWVSALARLIGRNLLSDKSSSPSYGTVGHIWSSRTSGVNELEFTPNISVVKDSQGSLDDWDATAWRISEDPVRNVQPTIDLYEVRSLHVGGSRPAPRPHIKGPADSHKLILMWFIWEMKTTAWRIVVRH